MIFIFVFLINWQFILPQKIKIFIYFFYLFFFPTEWLFINYFVEMNEKFSFHLNFMFIYFKLQNLFG